MTITATSGGGGGGSSNRRRRIPCSRKIDDDELLVMASSVHHQQQLQHQLPLPLPPMSTSTPTQSLGAAEADSDATDVNHHQQGKKKRNNITPRKIVSRLFHGGERRPYAADTVSAADCDDDDSDDDGGVDEQYVNVEMERIDSASPIDNKLTVTNHYLESRTSVVDVALPDATATAEHDAVNNDIQAVGGADIMNHNHRNYHGNDHNHERHPDLLLGHHSVAYSVGSKFIEVKLLDDNNHGEMEAAIPSMAEDNENNVTEIDTHRKERMIATGNEEGGDGNNRGSENSNDVKMDIDDDGNIAPKQQQRTTRTLLECITGKASPGGGKSNAGSSGCDYLMCGSNFPDDICALWSQHHSTATSTAAACHEDRADISSEQNDVETMENVIDNDEVAVEEDEDEEEEHQQLRKKRDRLRRRRANTTKRAKVDAKSLPDVPAPIELPQVFIKRPNSYGAISSSIRSKDDNSHHNAIVSMDEVRDTRQPDEEEEEKEPVVAVNAAPGTARVEDGRPPMYLRSKSATATAYRNTISGKSNMGLQLSSSGIEHGMVVPPFGRSILPPQLLLRGRSLQLFSHTLDGGSSSGLPPAFSLSLQKQPTRGENEEKLNVVSSSSSEANLSSKDSDDAGVDGGGSSATLAISSLTSFYRERYLTLCEEGKFHIRFLDTYQGRNPNSTNGCTVIAPLMCVQYFTSDGAEQHKNNDAASNPWNDGILDEVINHVIDDQAAAILTEVRNKLNLEQDAFIIPSDVHDHFITEGLLSTSQFVGVCGGNILDDLHVQALKSALLVSFCDELWKNRKVAATFFFHGHVIALHVVGNGGGGGGGGNGLENNNQVSIELIDSLPDPETWLKRTNRRQSSMSSYSSLDWNGKERESLTQCNSEDASDEWDRLLGCDDGASGYDELPKNAIRVRCTDVEQFDILIRHYACSKFTKEEQQFIDSTAWDDNSGYCECSFDPRVFQAFIWAEAE